MDDGERAIINRQWIGGKLDKAERSPVERCVMRFDQDALLDVLYKTLIKIYNIAVPLRLVVKEDNVEFIYPETTQKTIDFYREEIRKRKCELMKPIAIDIAGA